MRKCLITLIILGIFTVAHSQDNKGTLKFSISEAQTYALQNNRSIRSAKIDIDIANKQVKETFGVGLPQLTLAANYLHQFVIPELNFGPALDPNSLPDGFITKNDILNAYVPSPFIPLGVRNNTTIDLTVSQLIFSGEYLVGLQAIKVLKQVTEKALVKTEAVTKESVAGTYYLILVLDESVRVLKESLQSIDKTYNDLSKMNKQGFNEETDVDQIKISWSNLKRLITSIESQRETSIKLLKYQLGMDFSQPIELTDSLPGLIKEGNMQYLSEPIFTVANSIDYKMLTDQVEISALMLKREQSKLLPTLSAFYRHQEQTNQPSFNFAVKDVVGATLSFPIFTSGQRSAKISQARFNLDKSQIGKKNAEQGLIMEFEKAFNDYQTAFSNYTTNSESIILSKKVYDKTLIKYHEGVSTSFELSQNQTQYLTAESTYYNSILSLLNAKAKLDRILRIN
ncbi:MAG TPA: TolC family protein [Bacteroidales bacterium]|nr:TolC family protein [Bacteroidales bacterium]